jgi:hypothetical protein
MSIPEDVQKIWYNVTRRMQSLAKSNGLSVITAKVLVKSDGTPLSWKVERHILEPRSLQDALLNLVGEFEEEARENIE